MLCYFADPKIYIFPRTRNLLCKENPDTKKLDFVKILNTFEDSNLECPSKKNKFKKIETRIYSDLAKEIDENTVEVSRYFSVGYLKKQDDDFLYFPDISQHNHSLEVIAKCKDSNILCTLKWVNDRGQIVSNENDNNSPITILPTGYNGKYSIQNILLKIRYPKDLTINSQEITIEVKKTDSNKKPETLQFALYKNTQTSISDFNYKKAPIKDFFIIPKNVPLSNSQRKIILELKKINNQVFARNKKMSNEFCFLPENEEYNELLIRNIKESIKAFKTSDENSNIGCKSNTIVIKQKERNVEINFPYKFNNYGQDEQLLDYLLNTYIDNEKDDLKGIIIDKNFLYGNYIKGDLQNQIEGIKNLYDYVVLPFINGIIQHAESYLFFNRRWLSCPKYNNLYQRGTYTIPNGTEKVLYKNNGTSQVLPAGTKIDFKIGADKYAFDKGDDKHRYKITHINGTPASGEVELSLDDKKLCDDRKNQNYSNYTETDTTVADSKDKKALSVYNTRKGIPYYMNKMDSKNNKGAAKLLSDEILNWNEDEKNWYLYKRKPNTGDFGIDCSGYISNSLSSFKYNNGISHFKNNGKYFQNDAKATIIRDNFCRELPITENTNGLSYLQKGDILVSKTHIAFCFEEDFNTHIPMSKINGIDSKYFTILQANGNSEVSNDEKEDTEESCVFLTAPSGKYKKGFFLRVIKGPFKHWGVELEENSDTYSKARVERICLWY